MPKQHLADAEKEEREVRRLVEQEGRQARRAVTKYGVERIAVAAKALLETQQFSMWVWDAVTPKGLMPDYVHEAIKARYPAFFDHLDMLKEQGEQDIDGLSGLAIWSISRAFRQFPKPVASAARYFMYRTTEGAFFNAWFVDQGRIQYGRRRRYIPPFDQWVALSHDWAESERGRAWRAGQAARDEKLYDPDTLEEVAADPSPGPSPPEGPTRLPSIPSAFLRGSAPIPTNHATWALLAAIHMATADGGWAVDPVYGIPAHTLRTSQGRGAAHVTLGEPEAMPDRLLPVLWEKVHALDDLTSDVLLICLAHWAAAGADPDRPIEITVDSILDARGVARMRRTGQVGGQTEPANWQHGHRREDRLAVGRALAGLEDLWLRLVDVEVIPSGRGRKAQRLRAESRALAFLDRVTHVGPDGHEVLLAVRFLPGQWASAYAALGLRQTGLLAQKVLAYDPYRERPEKRLGKYLTFQYRFNARRQAGPLRRRVSTLLEQAGIQGDAHHPERTRQRLVRALDRLRDDGLIDGWAEEHEQTPLPARRWIRAWLERVIDIDAPMDIKQHYERIGRSSGRHAATTGPTG